MEREKRPARVRGMASVDRMAGLRQRSVAACFYVLSPQVRWPIVMPAGVHFIACRLRLALSLAATRPFAASPPVSIGVWTVTSSIVILSIWPAVFYKMGEYDRQAAAHQVEMADPVKQAERREQALAKLRTMTADQPLEQWMSLLQPRTESAPRLSK